MPRPRDLLQRFRLAGTPGAPAAPGVPADRVAEVSAELEPVLARLAAAEQEAERLRTGARDEAARRIRDAAGPRAGRPRGRPARRGRRAGRRRRPGPEPGGRRARRRARGGEERGRPHHPAGRRADAGVRRPGDRRAPLRRARGRPVTAAWVAGTVRARALARRRLGAVGARELARSAGLPEARSTLARTPYGDGLGGQELAALQHQASATLLWHLRVLAGWLPRDGAQQLRLLAGGLRDRQHRGAPAPAAGPPRRAGRSRWAPCRPPGHGSRPPPPRSSCGRWWPPPRGATRGLSTAPAASASTDLRLAWAQRVVDGVPGAEVWARGATALLLVRETLLAGAPPRGRAAERATALLGAGFVAALDRPGATLGDLRATLPGDARWVLADVEALPDLWRAEAAWWHRVEQDALGAAAVPGVRARLRPGRGRRPGRRRLAGAGRPGRGRPGRDRPRTGGVRCPGVRSLEPTRMQRVAVVVPAARLRELLVQVADAGTVELDLPTGRDRRPRRGRRGTRDGAAAAAAGPGRPGPAALGGRAGPARVRPVRPHGPGRRGGRAGVPRGGRRPAGRGGRARRLGTVGRPPGAGRPDRGLRGRGGPAGGPPRAGPAHAAAGRERPRSVDDAAGADLRHRALPRPRPDGPGRPRLRLHVRDDVRGRRARRVAGGRGAGAVPGPAAPVRPLPPGWPFLLGAGLAACVFGVLFGEFFGPTGRCRCSGCPRWRSR